MATQSLQAETLPAYQLRGLGLYELHSQDILEGYQGGGRWLIPSGTTLGKVYEVLVSPMRPERNSCECVGYLNHHHCSHLVAASRVAKKSAICDSCGSRRWWSEITEVFEDDDLLSWYQGDLLCRACIKAGAWV